MGVEQLGPCFHPETLLCTHISRMCSSLLKDCVTGLPQTMCVPAISFLRRVLCNDVFILKFLGGSCHQFSSIGDALTYTSFVSHLWLIILFSEDAIFGRCNFCVLRTVRMNYRESGRWLTASSKSAWLTRWSLWSQVATKTVKCAALILSCEAVTWHLGWALGWLSLLCTTELHTALPSTADFYLSQKNGTHQLQLPSKASWSCHAVCLLSVSRMKVAIFLDEADKQ